MMVEISAEMFTRDTLSAESCQKKVIKKAFLCEGVRAQIAARKTNALSVQGAFTIKSTRAHSVSPLAISHLYQDSGW